MPNQTQNNRTQDPGKGSTASGVKRVASGRLSKKQMREKWRRKFTELHLEWLEKQKGNQAIK